MPNPAGGVGSAVGASPFPFPEVGQAAGDIFGTVLGAFSKGGIFGEDAVTKEDVKNSITWRVRAAEKAGVSPLVALGAPVLNTGGGVSLGDFGQMGADIGRAASALTSKPDRALDLLKALQLRRAGLENDLIAAQIRKLDQPGSPPGVPGPVNPTWIEVQDIDTGKIIRIPFRASAQQYENAFGNVGGDLQGASLYKRVFQNPDAMPASEILKQVFGGDFGPIGSVLKSLSGGEVPDYDPNQVPVY